MGEPQEIELIGYYAPEIFGSYPQKLTGQNLQEDIHRIIIRLPQHSDCVSKHYMKIVILDAYTSNPGDLNWGSLEEFGELIVHDRTTPEEVLERSAGCEVVLTNKVILNSETLEQLPELKYIGVLATGTNVVDLNFAKERGICVTNIPGYSTDSVVQHVMAFILHSVLW